MLPELRRVARARFVEPCEPRSARLDTCIPFTTVQNVQLAIRRAETLLAGLEGNLHVVRVIVVPYPLDVDRPAVSRELVQQELNQLQSDLPLTASLWFSREWIAGFAQALPASSLVVLAYRKTLLPGREQKLARALKRGGHRVSIFQEDRSCSTLR